MHSFCHAYFIATGVDKAIAYQELNVSIELICKWFCYFAYGSLVAIVLFPLIYTVVNYFVLNLGSESFFLYPPTE